jgi:hypothetical protein
MLTTCLRGVASAGLHGVRRRHEESDSKPAIKNPLIQGFKLGSKRPKPATERSDLGRPNHRLQEPFSLPFRYLPPSTALVHAAESKTALKERQHVHRNRASDTDLHSISSYLIPLTCSLNPQLLTESVARLMYLRVYDSRVSSHQPAPTLSLCYLLTHAHSTLFTPTLPTITCTQVLCFLDRLTWSTVSCGVTTSTRLTVCLPTQPSVCESF